MFSKEYFNRYFDIALNYIKEYRDPTSQKQELEYYKWQEVLQNNILIFDNINLEKQLMLKEYSTNVTVQCLYSIIKDLFKDNENIKVEYMNKKLDESSLTYFFVFDKLKHELLLFKGIENCNYFELKNDDRYKELLSLYESNKYKHIYLMFDKAYMQVINCNEDINDPSRGTNAYSFKWFITNYFDDEIYETLESCLKQYIEKVNDYIGLSTIKSLNNNAYMNFKNICEYRLSKFDYNNLLNVCFTNAPSLIKNDFEKIKNQYLNKYYYKILLGNNDFSESLITAEWISDSLNKAKAIDLTVIAMSYFKTVEQLIFNLICLHSNEGRMIKENGSKRLIELNDNNIKDKKIDSTLGSMANFYKYNLDILRSDISNDAKQFIKESIFDYSNLRNGYSHKHNIHESKIIDTIKTKSMNILFLLLGSHNLTASDIKQLGYVSYNKDNYQKFYEYINFHRNDIFKFKYSSGFEDVYIACYDKYQKNDENGNVVYSGAYFRNFGKGSKPTLLPIDKFPNEMYLCRLEGWDNQQEQISLAPVEIVKILDNNKFIGPSIIEESGYDY